MCCTIADKIIYGVTQYYFTLTHTQPYSKACSILSHAKSYTKVYEICPMVSFRYKLYTSDNCYLQIQPNGEIMAVDFTYYNLQVSLQRFPVYNSLYDMTLQVSIV